MEADGPGGRGKSLFRFPTPDLRSTVYSFPRGSPFQDISGEVRIKSVWNVDLFLRFFRTCLKPGDLICDMFAGTATATAAAVLLGCNSVVVEILDDHLQLSKKRLGTLRNTIHKNLKRFADLPEEDKAELSVQQVVFIYIYIYRNNIISFDIY